MPIKNLNLRLVEGGKIKIGGKNPNKENTNKQGDKYRLPVKFDHFKITDLDKDDKDNFIPNKEIMEKLGDKPKKLDILLLSDDIDNNFPTSYASYQGNKCFCRGDGENASRRIEKGNEVIFEDIICNPETCDIARSGKCKPNGTLSVMLPQAEKVGVVYKFRTTSWNTIINILSSLESIKLMTGGVLFGLVFTMELIEKQTEEHGKIKIVNIVYNGSMQKMQIEAGRQKQLRISGSVDMENQNKLIKESGLLKPSDDPEEFYTQEEEEPEKKSKGANSDDLSEAIKKTPPVEKAAKKTAKQEKSENTGNVDSEPENKNKESGGSTGNTQLDIF